MKTQFTRGPWRVESSQSQEVDALSISVFHPDGSYDWKEFITVWKHPRRIEEAEANARLIAAAPELLYALDYIRTAVGNHFTEKEKEIVNNAIAKAIGGKEQQQ